MLKQIDSHAKWLRFIILALAYAFDTLNILLCIEISNCISTLYIICFWIMYLIDKLLMVAFLLVQNDEEKLTFLALDIFHLGWIYEIVTKKCSEIGMEWVIFRIAFLRGIILNFIQFIFFFYLNLLQKETIGINYRYLAYFLYLTLAFYYSLEASYFSQNFIAIFTYHLTLTSFLYLEDQYEIRLFYYNFMIMALQYVFIHFSFKKVKIQYQKTNQTIVYNILNNSHTFEETHSSLYRKKCMLLANFLAQTSRFIIFISVVGVSAFKEIKTNKNLDIYQINNIIIIFMNSIYFAQYLYMIIYLQISLKVIIQEDDDSLQTVNKQLQLVNLDLTKDIEITFNSSLQNVIRNQSQNDTVCLDQQCYEYYKMHQKINTIIKKQNIKIGFTSQLYIQCYYHLKKLLSSQEEINEHIILYIKHYSRNISLSNIIMKRIFKGFIFNPVNNELMPKLTKPEQILLKTIQSYVLSLKVFEKCFKDYTLNYLPQIIYDLQEI
ncbi:hypothetical protein ABPG74_019770 [Tetrahymena malaccensis]